MTQKLRGLLIAAASSISFGFIPLFTLPMMERGLQTPSILAYRFLIAAFLMGLLLLVKRISFKITKQETLILIALGLIYVCSAMGLQLGYHYMSSGEATVVHFTYPVYVILLMRVFYGQKPSFVTLFAILLAFVGVVCLAGLGGQQLDRDLLIGMLIVMPTGLAYASYIVIVNKSCVRYMNNLKLSFYALLFCGTAFLLIASFWGGVQLLDSMEEWALMLALAILPTVVANVALVEGVKQCGSTLSSILGALEPLTAVVVGFFVFDESLTFMRGVGIFLILVSVLLIALSGRIAYAWQVYRLRHR